MYSVITILGNISLTLLLLIIVISLVLSTMGDFFVLNFIKYNQYTSQKLGKVIGSLGSIMYLAQLLISWSLHINNIYIIINYNNGLSVLVVGTTRPFSLIFVCQSLIQNYW